MRQSENSSSILLLDDQQMILKTLSRMLEMLGHTVTTSIDGKETVRLYRESVEAGTPFDLLILDIFIENGSGAHDIIDELQGINPKVKALVSSGDPTHEVIINYKESGFTATLLKPFTIDQLKQTLTELL
ncbi:MAG: response regulator [Spirochaetes bacterium]|jgi:two-component system cell cycle sensor histidine kinase/response regulator CckA|nr:response regulator [Spirochaetota bacterium]